jgi:hypothetical protein
MTSLITSHTSQSFSARERSVVKKLSIFYGTRSCIVASTGPRIGLRCRVVSTPASYSGIPDSDVGPQIRYPDRVLRSFPRYLHAIIGILLHPNFSATLTPSRSCNCLICYCCCPIGTTLEKNIGLGSWAPFTSKGKDGRSGGVWSRVC